MTPAEAAQVKGVDISTVYRAIAGGTLRHERTLNRIALQEADVLMWEPAPYGERKEGTKRPRGKSSGRPKKEPPAN